MIRPEQPSSLCNREMLTVLQNNLDKDPTNVSRILGLYFFKELEIPFRVEWLTQETNYASGIFNEMIYGGIDANLIYNHIITMELYRPIFRDYISSKGRKMQFGPQQLIIQYFITMLVNVKKCL